MGLRKPDQGFREEEGGFLQIQQVVFEIEPQIARHLVVAGPAGMHPGAIGAEAPSQPVLHGGMDILMPRFDDERLLGCGPQRLPQPAPQATMFPRAQEPCRAETLDVTETSEDVPPQQPGVPQWVISHGVGQHLAVESRGVALPEGSRRVRSWSRRHARYSRAREA